MYLSIDQPTRSVRAVTSGARTVILGGEGHKVGQEPDTRSRYEVLDAWSRERFDVGSVDYRWSAQDYVSVDLLPFIGRLAPGSDRRHVATGFGKWGMTNGTVAGMLLADRITGRENPWAGVFDSSRVALRASARNFVKENVNVARRFVGDRLAASRAPEAVALRAGEACIAEIDDEKVAAYRDTAGSLHTVSARCTHLGCYVTWNNAELTWDCPCHGSRFTCDGRVIQGPAVSDLES